ncbi:HIRAN domain-containing protein, partial [Vibrio sp. V32_P6A28T40]
RQTDQFRIIAQPQLTDKKNYKIKFFINGIRYLSDSSIERISRLESGDELRFHFEDCNEHDCNAVFASTSDEEQIKVGYCPKYFNSDIRTLMKDPNLKNYVLTVSKVNMDAPAPYKLLCEFVTTWPAGFLPQMSEDYLAYKCQEEVHIQD